MATEKPPAEMPPSDLPPAEAAPGQDMASPPPVATPFRPVHAPPPTTSRRDRRLGIAGQVAAVVGIVLCLLGAVGVVAGRASALGTVDDIAAALDAQIAKADPLLTQVSAKLGEISGRVGAVADGANAVAADPSPGGTVADTLRAALAAVSERYQALRVNYAEARESLVSMADRLETLGRIVPAVSIPQGPIDALAALDARLQAFDAKVTSLITIDPGQGPINQAAAAIAQAANNVNAQIADLQSGIGDVQARVSALRTQLTETAGSIKLGITLGAIGSILVLIYIVLLNWVLFRHAGEIRRRTSAA